MPETKARRGGRGPGRGRGSDTSLTRIGRFITVERQGCVATVTFDRGDGRNPLSRESLQDLTKTARSFDGDLETRAIVLTGAKVFSAGADLKDPAAARRVNAGLLERRHLLKAGPEMCDAWERVEIPTIAAIEAYCIGGAVSLAVSCDFRIVGKGAHFRLPEIPLGMNMSWHTLPRLVALIGPARTKKLTIFGERVEAEEAFAWGLADEIVPAGHALKVAQDWASRLAALPPLPVRMSKQSINAAAHALNYAATFMDRDQFALTATSEDYREAVSAFLEKRAAKFTGR
jgi:enoyl-CoA hydratase/carnithine racemase